jgi:hypothetical protein
VDSNEEQYPVNPAELKGDSKFEIGSKQSGVGTFLLKLIDDTFDGESLVRVVEDVDNKVLLDDISNLSWLLLDVSGDVGNGIIIINFVQQEKNTSATLIKYNGVAKNNVDDEAFNC